MTSREFKVEGMSCQMCAKAVKQIFEDVVGVERAEIVLEKEQAKVEIDETIFDENALRSSFKETHYILN